MVPDLDGHGRQPEEGEGGPAEEEDQRRDAEWDKPALFLVVQRWANETNHFIKEDRGGQGDAGGEGRIHEHRPDAHEGELLEVAEGCERWFGFADEEANWRGFRAFGPFERQVEEGGDLLVENQGRHHADHEDCQHANQRDAEVVDMLHERHLAPGAIAANECGKHGEGLDRQEGFDVVEAKGRRDGV